MAVFGDRCPWEQMFHLLASAAGVDRLAAMSPNTFLDVAPLRLTRRIGLASAVMTSLKRIWSDKHLTLDTKLRIRHQTLVLSVLLYAADTSTPCYQLV